MERSVYVREGVHDACRGHASCLEGFHPGLLPCLAKPTSSERFSLSMRCRTEMSGYQYCKIQQFQRECITSVQNAKNLKNVCVNISYTYWSLNLFLNMLAVS